MQTIEFDSLLSEAKLPADILESESTLIWAAREGISGAILQPTIKLLKVRDLFIKLLNTDASNLNKFYKQAHLSTPTSEAILDTLSVYKLAFQVYRGNTDKAMEWLSTSIPALSGEVPRDLMDTFKGRSLIKDCLMVMEDGDFT